MSDRQFTLIELHFDGDAQFGPESIPGAMPGGKHEEETRDEAGAVDGEDGGRSAVAALVGLAALVGVAVALRKLRGDDGDELEDVEEPDVVVD